MYLLISLVLCIVIIITLSLYTLQLFLRSRSKLCRSSKHLVGKVVVITGPTSGIGLEAAINLAERGAKLILACITEKEGNETREKIIKATGNTNILAREMNLGSLESVRKFANYVLETENRLDILINNAGAANIDNVKSKDGLLLMMQINYYGPFLLTKILLPLLKSSAPSRIVNVASVTYKYGRIDFDNICFLKNFDSEAKFGIRDKFEVYANSKLSTVLATLELDRQLKGSGVTVNCLHPGGVNTPLSNNITCIGATKRNPLFSAYLKTPWLGAQTTIYLAVSPEVENVSGCYFQECKKKKLLNIAINADLGKRLWELSERFVCDSVKNGDDCVKICVN